MSVHEMGTRLRIVDGPVPLTAYVDGDGKIVITHTLLGLRIKPEDLRTVLEKLAPSASGPDAAAHYEVKITTVSMYFAGILYRVTGDSRAYVVNLGVFSTRSRLLAAAEKMARRDKTLPDVVRLDLDDE